MTVPDADDYNSTQWNVLCARFFGDMARWERRRIPEKIKHEKEGQRKGRQMKKGIIFDVDGTLWDSTEVVAKGYNMVIAGLGGKYPLVDGTKLKSVFGKTLLGIGRVLFPEETDEVKLSLMEQCIEKEFVAMDMEHPDVYPGVEETMKKLQADGYALYIVSNCPSGYIERLLDFCGLEKYFEGHLCPGDTDLEKADNIRLIVERYALDDAVYVGDTLLDRESSEKAGVRFIHAAYGFGEFESPFAIQDITELPEAAAKIFAV